MKETEDVGWWHWNPDAFQLPPKHLPPGSAERRKELYRQWRWVDDPEQVRRAAAEEHPVVGPKLERIQRAQRQVQPPEGGQHLREQIQEAQGLRNFLRRRKLQHELARLDAEAAAAREKLAQLERHERKLIASLRWDEVDEYLQLQEQARHAAAKQLLDLEELELQEQEMARRKKEAEEAAERRRLAQPQIQTQGSPKPYRPGM